MATLRRLALWIMDSVLQNTSDLTSFFLIGCFWIEKESLINRTLYLDYENSIESKGV